MKVKEKRRNMAKLEELNIGDVFRFENDIEPFEYYMVGEKDLIGLSIPVAGQQFNKSGWKANTVVKVEAYLTVE